MPRSGQHTTGSMALYVLGMTLSIMVHVQIVTACAMTCIKTAGCGSYVSMTDGRLDVDVNGMIGIQFST